MVHRICVAAVLGRVGYSATRSPIDNGHVETVDYGLQLRSALNDSLDDNFGKHYLHVGYDVALVRSIHVLAGVAHSSWKMTPRLGSFIGFLPFSSTAGTSFVQHVMRLI